MKLLAYSAVVLAALLFLASAVCCAVGIWTVGPDSGRWVGTAFLLFCLSFLLAFGGSFWIDMQKDAR